MSTSDNFDIFNDVVQPSDDETLTELSTDKKRKPTARKQKHNVVVEKTGVTGVTGVTASNGAASGGNTSEIEGVTGVTGINLDDAINPATTPPETVTDQSPSMEDRPCYRCHADYWHDADGKEKSPGVWWHGLSKPDTYFHRVMRLCRGIAENLQH